MKSSDFLKQVMDVRNPVLSQLALAEMLKGNMPSWNFSQRMKCTTSAVIDGLYYECNYFTLPQYLSVGDDADFIQWPLTIIDLQKFCDAHTLTDADGNTSPKFYIPPKKLVKNTWGQTDCKIAAQLLGASGDMTWPVKIGLEQAKINAAMKAKGCPITAFSRAKKAYITAPNVDGSKLHFTGWYEPNGFGWEDQTRQGDPSSGYRPQDATGNHEATYADYSHGCDLVYQDVLINGRQYDFADVCRDPKLCVLVSDQGPFNPRFPNAGSPPKATPLPSPPPAPTPSGYKGDIYKTNAAGAPVLIKASTLPASAGGAVAESTTSIGNVLLGFGVGIGGWLLLRRWLHAH